VNQVLNIAGYKFVALAQPQELQQRLQAGARARGLRGTILLAHEGINLFLAGLPANIESFLHDLRADPRLADLAVTQTWSAAQPFRKLLVKVKREIIRMNQPSIRPAQERAPAVDPATAKRWLDQGHDDQGRSLVLLDTRNGFEVDHGSFAGALDWRLRSFSDFPEALAAHRGELEGKTVLSFCTGGIRCEKAALHMRDAGLEHVWQLDGGILKYLQETDGAHFQGACFVFDQREALDSQLAAVP
jgi:UPF0176 protein